MKIEIKLDDVLPSKEEILKFGVLMKNRDTLLVEEDYETPENEAKIKSFDEVCSGCGVDGDELLRALIVARAFYLSVLEIELEEVVDTVILEEVNE